MKTFLSIILAIFISGCAFLNKPVPPVIPEAQVVRLAPDSLTFCDMLKEDIVITTFEDAILAYGELATQYGTCANKQADSIKLLKKFGGIK